ncbi:phosphotransferase family protein [Kocuria sp.]|uniref:phosphotransferase family protein n=1 Tax=Kocuria sp. TaxID=1871328 RepID=UPI0026DEE89A|nr:phosphotransferase [Kocuria sp.]MDO5618356.1 phosphotransferase [Kocuria sp.]
MVAQALRRMMPFADVVDAVLDELGERSDCTRWSVVPTGSSHLVVEIDKRISVRIAKNPTARQNLSRRSEVLRRLPEYSFEIPRPLTETKTVKGHTAVGLTWVEGTHRTGGVPAQVLGQLLEQLWATDTTPFESLLDRPGQHWGGHRRRHVILDEVVPLLLPRNRELAREAIHDLAELDVVTPRLVHSDLTSHNMLWKDRQLTGVIDWDHACMGDPAQDVASLALCFGWETLEAVVPPEIMRRARLHARIVPMQSVAYTLVQDMDTAQVNQAVNRADEWIDTRLRRLLKR